ncbi:MAG: hypothetical protein ACHBN1_34770 [Heteroscytonema crispum UTEX LB 1556]
MGVGARSLQSGRFPPAHFAPLVGEPLRSWGLAKGRSGVFPTQATGEARSRCWLLLVGCWLLVDS